MELILFMKKTGNTFINFKHLVIQRLISRLFVQLHMVRYTENGYFYPNTE